jgi:hypothetical protein
MMPEINDLEKATSEQRKKISKILTRSKLSTGFILVKFLLGLSLANFISVSVGQKILADTDPEVQVWFHFVCVVINAIFMSIYLNDRLRKLSDIVVGKVKEVLKNQE